MGGSRFSWLILLINEKRETTSLRPLPTRASEGLAPAGRHPDRAS